jgi:Fibrinogen beta and gamma chains, C-terminal globular domain
LDARCEFDLARRAWTVIQCQGYGSRENFNRSWTEYEEGFGSGFGNYWIGLKAIHALTHGSTGPQELRIDLADWRGIEKWVTYSNFSIGNASEKYRLSVSGDAEGTARDSLKTEVGAAFSTPDQDNDKSTRHCASEFSSGWWFHGCFHAKVNGVHSRTSQNAIAWNTALNPLRKVSIKIRPMGGHSK